MNTLQKLQNWYYSQCDGDWEHEFGIRISNIDNPGWSVSINLINTSLETKAFDPVNYGVGNDSVISGNDWLTCRVEDKKFQAFGGPTKLEEILQIFLRWQESGS